MSRAASFREILKEKKLTDGKYELSLAEFVRPFAENGEEVVVSGRGTSMLPTIHEECSLVMAPLPDGGARAGDILLYARENGQSVVHRVWRVTKNGYDMLGDNQLVIERNVPKEAAVALVQTIIYPDKRQKEGHMSLIRLRARYGRKILRRLAGRILRRLGLRRAAG